MHIIIQSTIMLAAAAAAACTYIRAERLRSLVKRLESELAEARRASHELALHLGAARRSGYRPDAWAITVIERAERAERAKQTLASGGV